MIELTRIHGKKVVVNEDLIQKMDAIPDTLLTFTTGEKMMVLETSEQVIQKILDYKRKLYFLQATLQEKILEKVEVHFDSSPQAPSEGGLN